jgi:L-fuconolactonase
MTGEGGSDATHVVDAHQHFWNPSTRRTARFEPYDPVDPIFLNDIVGSQLRGAGVERTVLIQAANSSSQNDMLFSIAERLPCVAGVVAWVPLAEPHQAIVELAALRRRPGFVGVRHLATVEPDPDWIVRETVFESLAVLDDLGCTLDVVAVTPRQLELVSVVAARFPRLKIVIDHLGKPPISEGGWLPWADLLADAAQHENVFAKISGLTLAVERSQWSTEKIRPFIDHALDVFGPKRVMMGGDWPTSILERRYARLWSDIRGALVGIESNARSEVMGGTATRFYGLPNSSVHEFSDGFIENRPSALL